MSLQLLGSSNFSRRAARAVLSGVIGVALAGLVAGPAMADPIPDPPPPALTDFNTVTTVDGGAAVAAPSDGSHFATPATVIGRRQTFTRGGALAWSSDTFEWYWTGSSMTSSKAWQADGYIFPNTVTLKGVKRTLATASQHLWRGTASIGAGVVTPWGAVNVYTTTITDYFTLKAGSLTHSDN